MATLFTCTVPTHDGDTYRVNIDDADYGGSAVEVELAYGAFSLRYEGDSRDMFAPVMPSKCTVAIAVSDDNLATVENFGLDLIESGEQRFTVRIDHKPDGGSYSLYWVGYVIPDLSGFQDITPPYLFNVVAADGLGRLKKIDYKSTSGDNPVTELTALEHVLYALGKDTILRDLYYAGSDIYIRTTVNWQDSNMGAPSAAKCPLANTKFSGAVFSDKTESTSAEKQFDHMTCFEVIESIARHFAARFYFCEGSWRFEQLNERDQSTFFERRFSKLGVYVSSVSAQAKDVAVQNTGLNNRLAGGVFSYLPALNKVQANYLHNTGGNRLEGYQNYWSSLSPFPAIVQFFTTSLSSDNVFRISGAINFEAELDTAYTRPWRYLFRLYVKVSTYTLEGLSTNLFVGGNGTTTLNPVVPVWNNTGTNYYEISSSFCFGTLLSETINFTFDTPPLPTGTTFEVGFYTYLADNVDNTGESATVNYWSVLGPSLLIRDALNPSADYETERQYIVTNDTVGNSEEIEQDFLFGHPVSGSTLGGVLTSPNSGVFTLSTATWDQGTGTEDYEFPQLWAAEIMAGRSTSRPVWSGSIKAAEVFASTRVIFPDNAGWIFLGGEFSATENTWTGEWVQAGVARSLVIATTPGIRINNTIRFPIKTKKWNPFATVPPGSVVIKGGFSGLTGFTGLAITALAVNEVATTVSAGTITSIPLGYAVNANDYIENDDIIIVNPSTGEVTPATVSKTSADGDTSLSIFSTTVPSLPSGSLILYGPLNKYTKQGGSHGKMPVGTAEGQALLWNNATEVWEPYSGLSDGQVLTWDTTNGWQAEAPAGIADGDTLSTGLTFPNTGLHILDTNATHDLIIAPGSNLTADRTLTVTTGDANRTLTLGGDTTLNGGTHSGTNTGDQTITLTGDVTGSGTGSFATTIANDAVTDGKLRNSAALSVIGRSANSIGDPADIAASVDGQVLRLAASTLSFGTVATAGIENGAVTNAKVATGIDAAKLADGSISNTEFQYLNGVTSAIQTQLDGKVDENAAITGATKTKITYDAKGLVTAGADATTADIADSTNKRYVTDTNLTVINNTSGTNTGDQTITLTGDVTGSGTGSFAATIAANAVTDTKLRDSVALSVIGRGANSTGDPADIAASVDGYVLRRSGTTLAFGEVATAGIANDAITYSKIQNVTDARLLGRSAGSAGDVQELTVGTGLLLSGGVLSNTVTSGVTGSGVANRLAIWSGTSSLSSDDSPLYFDGTNNRLGVNTASPSATIHAIRAAGSFGEVIRAEASMTTNLISALYNTNTGSGANAMLYASTASAAAGDPFLQFQVLGAGGTQVILGLDNSDSDKLKIKAAGSPSSSPFDSGITMTTAGVSYVGINKDAPLYDLDNSGTTRSRTFINTSLPPTVNPGTGMGTTPSGFSVLGGQNGFFYGFTTGSSPTTNGNVFQVIMSVSFPTFIVPTFSPANAQTATDISKFYITSSGNTGFIVKANGTLAASTAYALHFNLIGY